MKKYSTCLNCGGLLEYLYTISNVDIKMCVDCEWESRTAYDLVTPDTRLEEKSGG